MSTLGRKLLGVSAAVVTLGALVLIPTFAAPPTVSDTAGGIELWGGPLSDPIRTSYSADDGPWTATASRQNVNTLLAIREDGSVQAMPGVVNADVENIPAGLSGKRAISISSIQGHAMAATEDGTAFKWGGTRGLPNGSWTPEQLGGKAVGVSNSTTVGLVQLDTGEVVVITTGYMEKVENYDSGELLTDVVKVNAGLINLHGAALRADGSVARLDPVDGWTTLIEADPLDPIVDFDLGYQSNTNSLVAVTASGNSYRGSTKSDAFPKDQLKAGEKIVQVAQSDSDFAVARTDRGNLVAWNNTSPSSILPSAMEVPDEVANAYVHHIDGGGSTFRAIVGAAEDDDTPVAQLTQATVTGDFVVGETLQGIPATFSGTLDRVENQWILAKNRVLTDVDGDSDDPLRLTLTEDMIDSYVMLRTTAFKEGQSNVVDFSLTYGPIEAAPTAEIINTTPPTITGTPQVGETLTASDGTWAPEEVTLAHQWLRDSEEIADATDSSYELTSDDEGARISVRVTASHDDLDSVSATSAETETVQAAPVEDVVNDTKPAITGTAKVGETLNASTGEWTPSDANFAYQWLRDGNPIGSATSDSYELVAADQGAKISVRVTASKTGYNSASATSEETAEVAAADLAVTSVPVISGTPQEGHTLAGTPAVFNDPTATVTNQWFADEVELTGETGNSLELTADHVGKDITFKSTAVRGDDTLDSTSGPFGPVVRADIELSIQTPSALSGTPRVGQTLTATEAEFGGDIDSVTHEWLADGTVLSGASGTSLELTSAHVGKTITFRSTAVRGENSLPSVSDPVGPVLVVLGVTTKPSISGTAEVGKTLTGTPAVFNDAAVITNQWFADGVAISGATGDSLELTADHLGAVITFKSTATRGSDTAESTSDATDAVKLKALKATSDASISGTAQVGETLTGTPAEFNDSTATITNQWFADGDVISGATGLTLELTDDLVGKRITFVSTATRGDDTKESVSAASAAVVPATPDGDFEGKITLKETVRAGETVTVNVGTAYAGQEVEIWMFSTPRMIGSGTVSTDGTIRVTIPANAELGEHTIAAYDEAGALIGFQGITVVAADGSGGGGKGSGSSGSGSGAGKPGSLTRTGVEIGKVALPIGAALLALGFGALVIARRRTN